MAGALGGYDLTFDVRRLYLHNIQLIGSSMHTPTHFDLLMNLARQGDIGPPIAAVFPLEEAARAQEELAHRNHIGKIVLHPNPDTTSPAACSMLEASPQPRSPGPRSDRRCRPVLQGEQLPHPGARPQTFSRHRSRTGRPGVTVNTETDGNSLKPTAMVGTC
ncbi:hypothetical protein GCM10009757_40700 [Streptomyces cheonanensis]|uniref:Zinc-binding dehydrogenase n=1 Tax=Streptomyces cheonanensis TaxID=312720 RepID=A0ABP5GZX3_9ACTN